MGEHPVWLATYGLPRQAQGPGEKLSVAQPNRLGTPLCVRSAHQDVAMPLGMV